MVQHRRRITRRTLRDHVFIVSSGVAFLALFALLPMLTALVSVYGLVSSPGQLSHQLQSLYSVAPQGVVNDAAVYFLRSTLVRGVADRFAIARQVQADFPAGGVRSAHPASGHGTHRVRDASGRVGRAAKLADWQVGLPADRPHWLLGYLALVARFVLGNTRCE